jgi:hypothetical protein
MFAKVFGQIYDSSIAEDYNCRRMFMDLLVLADATGAVDMTHEAIARRTNVPLDEVCKYVTQLCQPDPKSRSKLEEGKRLIPLDKNRDWGWQIVNHAHYRNLRDEESRRTYFRDAMRKYRKRKNKANTEAEAEARGETSLNGVKGALNTSVEDWLKELESDKTYQGIEVRREYGKMLNWCKIRKKQATKRRFVNWLNNADKALPLTHSARVDYKRNHLPPPRNLTDEEFEAQRKIALSECAKAKAELRKESV